MLEGDNKVDCWQS